MRRFAVAACIIFLVAGYGWGEDSHGGLATDVLAKTSVGWNGQALPNYAGGKPEITILRITIPAGAQLPVHTHSVINAGVLLKGQLTVVTDGNQTLHLKAGQSIVEVVNTWHYGKNEGATPAEIIVFYAGVEGTPITTNK